MGLRRRVWVVAVVAGLCLSAVAAAGAEEPLKSPWDGHAVKASDVGYRCPAAVVLPVDIQASDFYSDAKHSVIDEKRKAAYDAASALFAKASEETAAAADEYQKSGSVKAAACVVVLLEAEAKAGAMTGTMSSNQANYVQNWTLGGLAIAYLKVRGANAGTAEQRAEVTAWMDKVGGAVETYFQERREKKKTDGQNNHLYWAGLAVMTAGIAANDRKEFEWGVSTYKDGVGRVAEDGTLPLEMDRGQRALHYHLFAGAPLVTMAEMGAANGLDLYGYDNAALHRLVARSMAGLVDNRYFAQKAGVTQDTPENGKVKPYDVQWVAPYLRRFPDAGIGKLLSQAGEKPYGYLGGLPPR